MKKTEAGTRGQTLRTETAPVREKGLKGQDDNEALMGRKMGGGPLDLSHSLGGGDPEQDAVGEVEKAAPKPRR